MIIGITGYGATGASAYIDLLKEFDGMQSFTTSFEFQLLQQPDGIEDLRFSLVDSRRRIQVNTAISRFVKATKASASYKISKVTKGQYEEISKRYVERLYDISWMGRSEYDPQDIRHFSDLKRLKFVTRVIRKILSYAKINWPPLNKRYFSFMTEESFVRESKQYLKNILEACEFDLDKPIILEQLFNTTNPERGIEYFDNAYSIVVDRDPRDVYILTNYVFRNLCYFMPHSGNVEDFVKYYKDIHAEKVTCEKVRYVKYEDLIYNYENTCKDLESWLEIKHLGKGQFFKPQYSINNTRLYLQHPELSKEIEYIEKELSEYLYPFDEMENNISYIIQESTPFDNQIEIDRKLSKSK